MEVLYSPETRQADTFPLVTEATAFLEEEVLGPNYAPAVSAEWVRFTDHRGQSFDRLTLRDSHGEVYTDFLPFELTVPLHMRSRLFRIWGRLNLIHLQQVHERGLLLSRELVGSAEEGI